MNLSIVSTLLKLQERRVLEISEKPSRAGRLGFYHIKRKGITTEGEFRQIMKASFGRSRLFF